MRTPLDTTKLSRRLGELLRARRQTVAVAESITCGNLQAAIGATPGASEYFLGGMTAYVLPAKTGLLGVDAQHAAAVDCVSPTVARQMAAGVARRFQADWTIATTGYAEPNAAAGFPQPGAYVCVWHQPPANSESPANQVPAPRPGVSRDQVTPLAPAIDRLQRIDVPPRTGTDAVASLPFLPPTTTRLWAQLYVAHTALELLVKEIERHEFPGQQ